MERYLREAQVMEAARARREAKKQQDLFDKYLQAEQRAQQVQQPQQAQQDSSAGFLERAGETIGDVVTDVGYGILDGIEGIVDLGIGLVGAVGGIFDDDFKETMKQAIEYDASYEWVEKHGPDWSDSYLDDDSLVKQIARSVGGMLPSVAVSFIPGAGTAAALGTLGVSAAGSAAQEAYQDGADFYEGLGYGVASGGVEVASEALLGGVTSKVFGGGLINPGNAVAKTGAKRIFKGMAEEAAEEVFASAVNPLAKTIYKGGEALEEYGTPEFYKGLAESAIAGAGAAGAMGAFTGDFTKKRDVAVSMKAATELRNKRAELFNEDKLTEEADTNIRDSVEANLAKVERILKKSSPEKRADLMQAARLGNYFEEDGSIRQGAVETVLGEQIPAEGQASAQSVFTASNKQYASPELWNSQQKVSEELAKITEDLRAQKENPEIPDIKVYQGELSDVERSAFKQLKKAMTALSKRTATGLNFVITEASPHYSGVLPNKSNTVYITKDTLENGTWAKNVVHEVMHYNEGTADYNTLVNVLASDAKAFQKAVAELTGEKNPYRFTPELYQSMKKKLDAGKWGKLTEDEQSLFNELGAKLAENLLGNERFIERIVQKDASLAKRILAKIRDLIEAFRTLGNKEARLEYKRLKAAELFYTEAIETAGLKHKADELEERADVADGKSQLSLKSSEDVDNYTDEEYNEKNKNSGGYHERENNRDTDVLERRQVSAFDRSENNIGIYNKNTETLKGLLGLSDEELRRGDFKAGKSEWLEDYQANAGYGTPAEKQRVRRFLQSFCRKLSGTPLNKIDTVGRKLPDAVLRRFSKTAFKTSDGTIISLWHWTDKQFDQFDRGDIGFHAGTFDASHAIMFDKSKPGEKGVFKEMYFNSTNPLFIARDLGTCWTPELTATASNVFDTDEILMIKSFDGYDRQQYDSDASVQLRKMLKEKGYDSIVYTNDWEGGLSVIAFDNDQFYTVAENGIEKRKQDSSENVNSKSQFSLKDDTLIKKYPKLDLNQDISEMDGVPAIRLEDGSVIPVNETHVQFIINNNIDVEDIESGGWISNGFYEPSERSDTLRYKERMLAKKRMEQKRKEKSQFSLTSDRASRDFRYSVTKEEQDAEAQKKAKAVAAELKKRAGRATVSEGTKKKQDAIHNNDKVFDQKEVRSALKKIPAFKHLPEDIKNSLVDQLWIKANTTFGVERRSNALHELKSGIVELFKESAMTMDDLNRIARLNVRISNIKKGTADYTISKDYAIHEAYDEIQKIRKSREGKYFEQFEGEMLDAEIAMLESDIDRAFEQIEESGKLTAKGKETDSIKEGIKAAKEKADKRAVATIIEARAEAKEKIKASEEKRKKEIREVREKSKKKQSYLESENQRMANELKRQNDKQYTKKEASKLVHTIVSKHLDFDVIYGDFTDFDDMVKAVWNSMNGVSEDKKGGISLDLADYMLQTAVVHEVIDSKELNKSKKVLEVLQPYIKQIDLSNVMDLITDKKVRQSLRSRWGIRKAATENVSEYGGTIPEDIAYGTRPETLAELLEEIGVTLESTHPVDVMLEIDKLYTESKNTLQNESETELADMVSDEEYMQLRQKIAKEILNGFYEMGSASASAKKINQLTQQLYKQAENMRKRIEAANERTRLSREQAKLDVQAAEDKAKRAREEARETEAKNKQMNRVKELLKKAKDLKEGTYRKHSEFQDERFQKSVGALAGLLMQGNLKQGQARTVAKDLLEWYTPDNPLLSSSDPDSGDAYMNPTAFQPDIQNKLESIANGVGFFTSQELRTFADVIGYFNHFVESFDKIYRNNQYVEAKPVADKFVKNLRKAKGIRIWQLARWFESGYVRTFGDPLSLMKYADKYNPEGFFTETFRELEKAIVGAAVTEMKLMEKYNQFFKNHKGYQKRLEKETIDYNNSKINVDAAICLYMTSKVDDAWKGLVKSGFKVFVDGKSQDFAELIKDGGDLTDAEIEARVDSFRLQLRESLTKEDLAFIETLETIFNEDCYKLKFDTDITRLGYSNVMDKYYFPLMRANVARNIDMENWYDGTNRVSSLSMNKDRAKGASGELGILRATEVMEMHIRQIAMYSNLAIPIDNFNRIFNLNVGSNPGKPDSIAALLKGGKKEFYTEMGSYLHELILDLQGRSNRKDTRWANETLGKIRSGYAKFQLGANTKTWLTQLSSFFAASNILDYSSIVKGMSVKNIFKEVDEYCDLAKHRHTENTAVKAEDMIDKTGKVGDVLMTPIGWVDRFVVAELFGACQVQVEKDGGAKLGTVENKKAAGELLERVLLETQQNSVLTGKSAAMRSGNELLKSFTMFSSDSMKVFGRFMDAQGERFATKYELKNNKDLTASERNAMEGRLKKANKQVVKATSAIVTSAVFMALLGLLFRSIRRKNKDKDAEEIAWETAFDGVGNMLGGLPILRDIYSRFSDSYELDTFALSALNDTLDAIDATVTLATETASGTPMSKQEVATSIRKVVYSAGQMLGIPTRNLYNTVSSVTGMISDKGAYYLDDLFYKQPYKADLQKAIEENDEQMIGTITGIMIDEKVSTESAEVRSSMKSLIEAGHSVLPKALGDTLTYDGEEYELSASERKRFEKIYSAADQAVEKLVGLSQFKEADEEAQAKAMRLIWDTYYNLARDEVLGIETETKNVLFAQAMDIEKLAMIVSVARSIKADTDKSGKEISGSRKKKITEYVESLRLSAAEKYMIMGYLGYSNVHGESKVKSYIGTLDLSSAEQKKLLEYSGYKEKE